MAYDNLLIKAYVFPRAQNKLVKNLTERIPVAEGEAAIYPEDGYLLMDIAQ